MNKTTTDTVTDSRAVAGEVYTRDYMRRALNDLANILTNLPNEQWTNPMERDAVLKGLTTWPTVLRNIALRTL